MAGKTGAVRAGGAYVEIFGEDGKLRRTLANAKRRLNRFSASASRAGRGLVGVGAAAAAPLALAVRSYASVGDNLQKMAGRTGIAASSLSELSFAADQSGTSIETVEAGVRRMQRVVSDAGRGLKSARDALDSIGLSSEALAGLSPERQFELIAEGLSRIPDMSKRAAVAQELLGRSGTQLLPMFAKGAAGIAAMREQAQALGLTISDIDADRAARLTDAFDVAGKTVKRSVFAIGAALAPMAIRIAEAIGKVLAKLSGWIDENRGLVVGVALASAASVALGAALLGVALAAKVAAVALGLVSAAIGAVGAVLAALATPAGAAAAGFVALAWVFDRKTGQIRKAIGKVGERLRDLKTDAAAAMGGVRDALEAGDIGAAWDVIVAGLRVSWLAGMDALLAGWRSMVGGLSGMWLDGLANMRAQWSGFAGYVEERFRDSMAYVSDLMALASGEIAVQIINANPMTTAEEKRQQVEILREDQGRSADAQLAAADAARVGRAKRRADALLAIEQEHADAVAALQEDLSRAEAGGDSPELAAARADLAAAVRVASAAKLAAEKLAGGGAGAGGFDEFDAAGVDEDAKSGSNREKVFTRGRVARRQAAFAVLAAKSGPEREQDRLREAVTRTDDAVKKSAKTWTGWKQAATAAAAATAAMLGTGAEVPAAPQVPAVPEVVPEVPAAPQVPEVPAVEAPPVPEVPAVEAPQVPEVPSVEAPQVPEVPSVEAPQVPEVPSVEAPQVPEVPSVEAPQVPEVPSVEAPQVPEVPSVEAPQVPEAPEVVPDVTRSAASGDGRRADYLERIGRTGEDATPAIRRRERAGDDSAGFEPRGRRAAYLAGIRTRSTRTGELTPEQIAEIDQRKAGRAARESAATVAAPGFRPGADDGIGRAMAMARQQAALVARGMGGVVNLNQGVLSSVLEFAEANQRFMSRPGYRSRDGGGRGDAVTRDGPERLGVSVGGVAGGGVAFDASETLAGIRAQISAGLPTIRPEIRRPEAPAGNAERQQRDEAVPVLKAVAGILERIERKPGGARFG